MRRRLRAALTLLAISVGAGAQAPAKDAAELTALVNEFLAGASRNDAGTHERFWADELVYTASAGRRIGKADILKDVRSAPPPKPSDPKVLYSAEDIRIQQYGETRSSRFAWSARPRKTRRRRSRNTGTRGPL